MVVVQLYVFRHFVPGTSFERKLRGGGGGGGGGGGVDMLTTL